MVPVARASEQHPSLSELEGEVMCPVCGTTLDQSNSPAAEQIKRLIRRAHRSRGHAQPDQGRLVAEYGEAILAAPERKGFGLLAWWLPIVGILAAALLVGAGAWRWSHARDGDLPPGSRLDPALERRLDDELRRFEG